MSAASRIYKLEDLKKLEKLNLDILVTPENFSRIIYAYCIEGKLVSCSLLRVKKKCNTKHNNGYIAELSDGQLGVIGGDCAEQHFSADSNIIQAINRFEDKLKIDQKLEIIYKYIENYESLKDSLEIAKDSISKSFSDLENIYYCLGKDNCRLLQHRAKSDKPVVNVKSYKLNEKDEYIYQATHSIGSIPCLKLFNMTSDEKSYLKNFNMLRDSLNAAKNLEAKLYDKILKTTNTKLDTYVSELSKKLQGIDRFIIEVKELAAEVHKFLNSDLDPICYVSHRLEDQEKAATLSLMTQRLDRTPTIYLRSLEIKLSTKLRCHRIGADN